MRTKVVTRAGDGAARTMMAVLEPGDEVMSSLLDFARDEDVRGASFTGLGAVHSSVIAFFDREHRRYEEIQVDDQVEVLSLVGNAGWFEDAPRIHAHVVLGWPDGSVRGGHLVSATVWPTLEVTVDIHDEPLLRALDEESGLPLLVP